MQSISIRLFAHAELTKRVNGNGVTNPGTALSGSTFGTILAANPPRILQLSLKMDF